MLLAGLAGFLGGIVYASIFEWIVHRWFMHTDKLWRIAFERHAIGHHSERRSLQRFYASPEENARYEAVESSFMPILWAAHSPAFFLIGWLWSVPVAVGAALATLLYMLSYEVLHFFIHIPRNYFFQRTRLFRVYCEYHRIHHHKARWNYNVVLPIADVLFGTFTLETIRPEPSVPSYVPADTGPLAALKR